MEFIEALFYNVLYFILLFLTGAIIGHFFFKYEEVIYIICKEQKSRIKNINPNVRDNLAKIPSKKEIEKRQKLVPIYLTIISIFIALTKINSIYSQNLANNSTIASEKQPIVLELVLELIQTIIQSFDFLIMVYVLFLILIIGYYIQLDSQSIKQSNKLGIWASICFGLIFTLNLQLLTSHTHLEMLNLMLLFLVFVLVSGIVAVSLVWTFNEKKRLVWKFNEENPNVFIENK